MTDYEKWRKFEQLRQERADIALDYLKIVGRMKVVIFEMERFQRELKTEEARVHRTLQGR